MAKTVDPVSRFSRLRDKSGDLDGLARSDMDDLALHHAETGWAPEQIDELRADFRDWWRRDAAAARQYLADAAAQARHFLDAIAARCRQAEESARDVQDHRLDASDACGQSGGSQG